MTQLLSQIDDAVGRNVTLTLNVTPPAQGFASAKAAGIAGGTNRASIFYAPFPLTFVDGEGARVKTADGQTLTDFLGNLQPAFWYSPEPVIQAVTNAMGTGHALGAAPTLRGAGSSHHDRALSIARNGAVLEYR